MTNPIIEIFDASTGFNEVRTMTDSEWEIEQNRRAANEKIVLQMKEKKENAIDKLSQLGLSIEDIKALGLG